MGTWLVDDSSTVDEYGTVRRLRAGSPPGHRPGRRAGRDSLVAIAHVGDGAEDPVEIDVAGHGAVHFGQAHAAGGGDIGGCALAQSVLDERPAIAQHIAAT